MDVQDDAYTASAKRSVTNRSSISSAVAHLKRDKVSLKEAVSMIRLASKRKHEETMDAYKALPVHARGNTPESITIDELEERIMYLKEAWRR